MTTTRITPTHPTDPVTGAAHAARHVPTEPARRLLLADAALTGVNGLAYLVLPGTLGDLFGVSPGLLVGLGIFLIVIAADVAVLATRSRIPRLGVLVLAELNLIWVAASVLFAVIGDLSTVGVLWTAAQALVVAAFAAAQLRLARRRP